jgi:hypothetical protein
MAGCQAHGDSLRIGSTGSGIMGFCKLSCGDYY